LVDLTDVMVHASGHGLAQACELQGAEVAWILPSAGETMMTQYVSNAPDRRAVVAGLAAALILLPARASAALPQIVVHKDPNCGCCGDWAEHLKRAGFPVRIVETAELDAVRARLGVPAELAACHTAEMDGYLIEGHVPASAIVRLLKERPDAKGLAVPGMPLGSPGMGGPPEVYEVVLFGPQGRRGYGRYRGDRELRG
jgi:hypothetical protein